MKIHQKFGVWILGLVSLSAMQSYGAIEGPSPNRVYVMTNKAHNNSVLVFQTAVFDPSPFSVSDLDVAQAEAREHQERYINRGIFRGQFRCRRVDRGNYASI